MAPDQLSLADLLEDTNAGMAETVRATSGDWWTINDPNARPIGVTGVWTLTLSGLEWLNANDRPHWAEKARKTKAIREAACVLARSHRIPALDVVLVLAYVHPSTNRKKWDPANWYPSVKAAVDGLVDAGVVVDDDHGHLVGPHMFPAYRVSGGGLTLVVAPVEPCGCGHGRLEHVGGVRCVRPGCGCVRPGVGG